MIDQINYEDIFNYCSYVNHFNRGLGDSFLHLFVKNMMTEDTARYIADRLNAIANNNEFHSFNIVLCHYSINGSHSVLYLEPYPSVYNKQDECVEMEEYMPNSIVLGFFVPDFMIEEEAIIKLILTQFIHAIIFSMEDKGIRECTVEEQPLEDENLCCYKSYKWHITVK